MRVIFGCVLTAGLAVVTGAASAQERRASHCIALANSTPGLEFVQKASWSEPLPDENTVRLRYIAHASFLIQTAGGLNVVTDYTGFLGSAPLIPDVVTMNHAHTTHWTEFPDPDIPHVLEGWGSFGEGVDHHLDLDEMLIRNVSTDIRSAAGGVEANGNSIFVFEVAGLCIGHLGHLHHVPTPQQYAALGRLDVVMAAVDGGMTLPLPEMVEVLSRLRSSVVIPMHWFGDFTLQQFLADISKTFEVVRTDGSELEVSLRSLPDRPTVYVLQPAYLRADE